MDHFVSSRYRLSFGVVVSQFRCVDFDIVPVLFFQGLGDAGVQAHLSGWGQFLSEGVLNQSMRELVSANQPGQLFNDPVGQCLF